MHLVVLLFSIIYQSIVANDVDCNQHIQLQEQTHNIPINLLRSISLVESGKMINGVFKAWPWTINVEGKGYIFKTKREAIQAVQNHITAGKTSIDVGPMQINLKYHPRAFESLEEAFDPKLNIAYGAKFLKDLYVKTGDWNRAVAYYHSTCPNRYNSYRKNVMQQWMQLAKLPYTQHETKNVVGQNLVKFDKVNTDRPVIKQTALKSYVNVKRVYYTLETYVASKK